MKKKIIIKEIVWWTTYIFTWCFMVFLAEQVIEMREIPWAMLWGVFSMVVSGTLSDACGRVVTCYQKI